MNVISFGTIRGMSAGLTLTELAELLDPPVTARQVYHLVRALGLKPVGYRKTGQPGRPAPCYDAKAVMEAHSALGKFWVAAIAAAQDHDSPDPHVSLNA
jgi:hypothetical protein